LLISPVSFKEVTSVSVENRTGCPAWINIERARIQAGRIILKLSGIDTRDQAESLRGLLLRIRKEDCALLKISTSDRLELCGWKVKTIDGIHVGIVVDVLKMPAQNVFVIDAEGKEILIPDVDAFIKTIDINNGIIVIDPIEGLLN
jgi:16S rRNA processing protein RimM